MPTDRDIALVKAALEAAAQTNGVKGWTIHGLDAADQIRSLDPAAIAATVLCPSCGELWSEHDAGVPAVYCPASEASILRQRITDLEHALDADQDHIAMLERQLASTAPQSEPQQTSQCAEPTESADRPPQSQGS